MSGNEPPSPSMMPRRLGAGLVDLAVAAPIGLVSGWLLGAVLLLLVDWMYRSSMGRPGRIFAVVRPLAYFDDAGLHAFSALAVLAGWVVYRGVAERHGRGLGKWLFGLEVVAPAGEPGILGSALRAAGVVLDMGRRLVGRPPCVDASLGTSVRRTPGTVMEGLGGGLREHGGWLIASLLAILGIAAVREPLGVLAHDMRANTVLVHHSLVLMDGGIDCCYAKPGDGRCKRALLPLVDYARGDGADHGGPGGPDSWVRLAVDGCPTARAMAK